jgi:hypothetical protein
LEQFQWKILQQNVIIAAQNPTNLVGRNLADARERETNLPLTKTVSAESDDVKRNSGFVALRKVPNV